MRSAETLWPASCRVAASCAAWLLITGALPAATLFVDIGDPGCSNVTGDPFCDLGPALAAASGGDVLEIAAGTYTGGLTIGEDLTLSGESAAGTVISGGAARVLSILSSTVRLERLRVTGGPAGGIFSQSSDLTLEDCIVSFNGPASGGGGIRQAGGAVHLRATRISNNTSDAAGVAGGAGIWVESGDLEIELSSILGNLNLHPGSPGGGIKFDGGSLTIRDSILHGNRSENNGGGIAAIGEQVTLLRTTVSDNRAGGGSGGLHLAAEATLINSTISINRATLGVGGMQRFAGNDPIVLNNVTIVGNTSQSGTGGINLGLPATLSNTVLAGNTGNLGPSDCAGELESLGYNLIEAPTCSVLGDPTGNLLGVPAQLAPLADNGGPTTTHAPLPGSPVIDGGRPGPGSSCETTDQRGVPRPADGDQDGEAVCDIGAFEDPLFVFGDGFESGDTSAW